MGKSVSTSISLPGTLDKEVGKEARSEHRTKSGFIQEAIRYYLENKRWKKLQQDIGLRASRAGIQTEEQVENLIDDIRR